MRINGYCCLGFVWKIIEPESASVRAGRSISPAKLRTIYYQQVAPIKVKFNLQIKRTGTGVSPPRHLATSPLIVYSGLYVKVIDLRL